MSTVRSFPNKDRMDHILSIALILAAVTAFIITIFVISSPIENERFSDFFILGENRTAGGYPNQIISGQVYPVYLGVRNHEYQNAGYIIEIWDMNAVFDSTTNSSHILAMDYRDRISLNLAQNETAIIPYNLSVLKTGYNRTEFLLFRDGVPGPEITGPDRINASYRDLYLWIAVR
jgi:uncharacterized membrane protein